MAPIATTLFSTAAGMAKDAMSPPAAPQPEGLGMASFGPSAPPQIDRTPVAPSGTNYGQLFGAMGNSGGANNVFTPSGSLSSFDMPSLVKMLQGSNRV